MTKKEIIKRAFEVAGPLNNWITKDERQAFIKGYIKAMEDVYDL